MPATLAALRGCLDDGGCQQFYKHASPETHATTPYDLWWKASLAHARLAEEEGRGWRRRRADAGDGDGDGGMTGDADADAAGGGGGGGEEPHDAPLPIPCFRNARYEPYVILPNLPSTPIYSEAFTGYGKNKIELITHLRFAGFRFFALPGAFVTHMPHVKSVQKALWEAGGHRKEMDRLYQTLVAQLISRYKRPRTPSCHPGRLL